MNTRTIPHAVSLKGSLFTLPVLQLLTTNIDEITYQLCKLAKQSPNFFQYTPVVIDLKLIKTTLAFNELVKSVRDQKMIPVGVRGGDEEQQQAAQQAGLALLPPEKQAEQRTTSTTQPLRTPSRLVTQPVRSGQQIVAKGGDLIVLGSVSHGAELLADGHIHIHGTLRGRALAGISGDGNARIFCKQLEAELVSIAGFYRLKTDLPASDPTTMTHIYLSEEHLVIDNL